MNVVSLGVEDPTEGSLAELLPGVHGCRVVVARFTHHVGEAGLAHGIDDRGDLVLGDRHRHGGIDVLARAQRFEHERPMGPALGEDRYRIHVGGEHRGEVGDGAVELLGLIEFRGALREEIGHQDAGNLGMELEQLRELAGELAGADDANGDRHEQPFRGSQLRYCTNP